MERNQNPEMNMDPETFFEAIEDNDIIVLDSNKDLPENWKDEINKSDKTGTERNWNNVTEKLFTYEQEVDDSDKNENCSDDDQSTDDMKPKRLLIFTTKVLLELFEDNDGKASVDGTFKITPVFLKQTFIMMIKKGGMHIPVAFGILPDKEEQSYRLFYYLLLSKVSQLDISVSLKSLSMDYEINIQRATEAFFQQCEIHGCYFHHW